jgi:hypothetical protein
MATLGMAQVWMRHSAIGLRNFTLDRPAGSHSLSIMDLAIGIGLGNESYPSRLEEKCRKNGLLIEPGRESPAPPCTQHRAARFLTFFIVGIRAYGGTTVS